MTTLIKRALLPLKQQVEAAGLPWEDPWVLEDEAPDFGEWVKADCRLGADVSAGKLCVWFICKEPLDLPEPNFDPEHHLALYERYVRWDYPVGMSPAGRLSLDLWCELDDLWRAGKGEVEDGEADEVRERCEEPWRAMTERDHEVFETVDLEALNNARQALPRHPK